MLSTIDNPFNPFSDFDQWLRFDSDKGYKSCELLAKVAKTSMGLPDELNSIEIERAIDTIVEVNPNGLYIKVLKD